MICRRHLVVMVALILVDLGVTAAIYGRLLIRVRRTGI